jgi:hypothetical protein
VTKKIPKATTPKNIPNSQRYEELCKFVVGKEYGIDPKSILTKQKEPGQARRGEEHPEHQLDLAWTHKTKMMDFKCFADAKLHERAIEKGYVDKIIGVRDSLGWQKAMIISTNGFTEGAVTRAKAADVALHVVNFEPLAEAVVGPTREVVLQGFVDLDEKNDKVYRLEILHKNYERETETKIVKPAKETDVSPRHQGYENKAITPGSGYNTKAFNPGTGYSTKAGGGPPPAGGGPSAGGGGAAHGGGGNPGSGGFETKGGSNFGFERK